MEMGHFPTGLPGAWQVSTRECHISCFLGLFVMKSTGTCLVCMSFDPPPNCGAREHRPSVVLRRASLC